MPDDPAEDPADSAVLKAGNQVDSESSFADLVLWLPLVLAELRESKVYGGDENLPPDNQRGIYLFTKNGKHLYVGRTGVTAKAWAIGESNTSFKARYKAHTLKGSPPWSAPFANRLMRKHAEKHNIAVPSKWWANRDGEGEKVFDIFSAMKREIQEMECRVVPFHDDRRGIRSTVAETYVHALLKTPHNDFLTS